jgi:hypothetical protein
MPTSLSPFRHRRFDVKHELTVVAVFSAIGLLLTAAVAAAGQIELLPF